MLSAFSIKFDFNKIYKIDDLPKPPKEFLKKIKGEYKSMSLDFIESIESEWEKETFKIFKNFIIVNAFNII